MRNAAMVLGIIGGVLSMFVGFFSFGYTELIGHVGEVPGLLSQVERVQLIRAVSFAAPILALAGGAMSLARALWGGAMMLVSAALMFYAFQFSVFTMFPIGLTAMGGLLAIAAKRPDEPKSHF